MGKLLTFLLLGTCALLMGCSNWHSNMGIGRPASLQMEINFGPEIYRKGYADGCRSGWAGYTTTFNKLFYAWRQDPDLAQDPMYYRIWKDAYSYCAYYAMIAEEHGLGNWR